MLRSNLREGTAGTRAGPSPKSARDQSQELLGQYTAASEIATGLPAFHLGGGKGWQEPHLQWLLHYTRMKSKR